MGGTTQETTSNLAGLEARIAALEKRVERVSDPDRMAVVLFGGELDRLMAAFVIATGAAACGMQVAVFCSFWGTAALRQHRHRRVDKTLTERMLGMMLPVGVGRQRLSHLDFGGIGRRLLAREMRRKNVPDIEALLDIAAKSGVELYVCEMSMSLFGIREDELLDYPNRKLCGVATFLQQSARAGTTLFI